MVILEALESESMVIVLLEAKPCLSCIFSLDSGALLETDIGSGDPLA